jgi:hypothetical protein
VRETKNLKKHDDKMHGTRKDMIMFNKRRGKKMIECDKKE